MNYSNFKLIIALLPSHFQLQSIFISFDLFFPFSAQPSGGHVIEYVLNQKKNPQLVIDGFHFHRCKSTKTKDYYSCAQTTTFGCRARAHVDKMRRVEVIKNLHHNHPSIVPRKIAGACRKQIQAMKKLKSSRYKKNA